MTSESDPSGRSLASGLASSASKSSHWPLDPVYRHARRETTVIVLICLLMMVWALGSARLFGFGTLDVETAERQAILGVPTWVFWSLLVPWVLGTAITGWFCFFYLADDPLGRERPPAGLANDDDPASVSKGALR
ncbi:MAG TPA: hypothetical protein PLI18_04310 [Pirellulaceae bacterium]|nr:hypothetical protein [Pirellulaceae bacterium]